MAEKYTYEQAVEGMRRGEIWLHDIEGTTFESRIIGDSEHYLNAVGRWVFENETSSLKRTNWRPKPPAPSEVEAGELVLKARILSEDSPEFDVLIDDYKHGSIRIWNRGTQWVSAPNRDGDTLAQGTFQMALAPFVQRALGKRVRRVAPSTAEAKEPRATGDEIRFITRPVKTEHGLAIVIPHGVGVEAGEDVAVRLEVVG